MSWIAVGVAAVGTIGGIISRSNANKKARQQLANRPSYTIDENIKKQLALAQTQYGGRSGAAAIAERNIFQQAANTQANINRAATDPTQSILGAGEIQGQTNQAFNQLQLQELTDEQRKLQNLINAQDALAAENKAAWGWNVKGKWQDTNAVEAAIAQNRANSWKDATQAGIASANAINASGVLKKGSGLRSEKEILKSMEQNKVSSVPLQSAPTGNWYNTANNTGLMPMQGLTQYPGTASSFGGNLNYPLFDINNIGLYGGQRPR